MASESDLRRARSGAQGSLVDLESLSHASESCSDGELRTLLAGISHRRSDQAARLLDWARQREDRTPLPQQQPAASGDEDPQALASEMVSRPATGVDGVAVLDCRQVTPDLVRFTVPRPLDFNFVAGQSVKVGVGGVRRSFSIVSAPHEPVVEFFVELVPGGQMSEQLRRLKAGDSVTLGPPKGGLRFDEGFPNHLMISTVTGINPFISILRDHLHRGGSNHRFHVLQGASYQDEFGYRAELERMAADHPQIVSYVSTVSRPQEPANQGWGGRTGRVDTLVADYLQQAALESGSTLVYACGHSGMLEVVERQLAPQGFQIRTESYD
ncbi:FAD-binding oxidoreductase [Marinobacter fonticola]|uniref:FAD-binding oxidoreductase n=1 Tax=Marinobacter fonticola TaxID=2603215 RepID=UPI0011E74EA8|nr:FAD-binding oxidoreductase [Marinobacter fonticola]